MDYVMAKYHSQLGREMGMYHTEVIWPTENDKSRVTLKPVATDDSDPTIWKRWKETSIMNLLAFLQRFSTVAIQVASAIWGDFIEVLPEVEVGDVLVVQQDEKSTVILVGPTCDVVKVKEIIVKTVDEVKLKAEVDAQTIERKLKLLPFKMKLFTKFRIASVLREKVPEVVVSVLPESKEVMFKGIRTDISEAQVTMYGEFEALTHTEFDTNQHIVEYVDRFCETVNQTLADKHLESLCYVEESKITIYSKTLPTLQRSMEFLRSEIVSKQLPIDREATMKVLESKNGSDKINSINNEQVVNMRLDASIRAIQVTGRRDAVDAAVAELGQFLDENVVLEKKVQLGSLYTEYVTQYHGKELFEIQSQNPGVSVQPVKDGFIIRGNEKSSDAVVVKLEKLKNKVIVRRHDVDKPGIPDLLRHPKGQRTLQNIAHRCECMIRNNINDEFDVKDTDIGASITSPSEVLCHANVNGCTLLVCKGDMTKENVDAIVNAANPDLQHIGGLAKVIVKAGNCQIYVI